MTFEDHFSKQSGAYAAHRPHYPAELFAYLSSVAPAHRLAWDCGTGSGQAARALADHFERVVGSDASAAQIAAAPPPPSNVALHVWPAEATELAPDSVDLITVAQALHWFALDSFYREVRRVLVPEGVIAAWCYRLARVSDEIDAVVDEWYEAVLGPYWPAGRRHIESGYTTLAFPFEPLEPPELRMRVDWSLSDVLGYLGTWSAVQRFRDERGADPRDLIREALADAWGEPTSRRCVSWPLVLKVGRVNESP